MLLLVMVIMIVGGRPRLIWQRYCGRIGGAIDKLTRGNLPPERVLIKSVEFTDWRRNR